MSRTSLKDQVVIVTGASSGIGRASVLGFAQHGARLMLASRNKAALEDLACQVKEAGCQVLVHLVDVTQKKQVDQMVERTLAEWGQVDVLVSNAGQYIRAPISAMDIETLKRSMAVNFYGNVYAVKSVLSHMLARQSGHIILVSTVDGKKGLPPDAPYVSAKFALTGFGDVLRQELRGTGVHVTSVFPGRVDTPMIEHLNFPWISAKIPAAAVARQIVRVAGSDTPAEIILPFQARLLVYASLFFPRLGDWIIRTFHLEGWESRDKNR
jgi:uncharacterized protein